MRDEIRQWLAQEGNAPRDDLELKEHRRQVLAWVTDLAASPRTTMGYPVAYGGQDDLGGYIAGFETLAFGDLSLLVKCGVQFGLWGGAIQNLGSDHHREKYLHDIATMKLPGCFAMTERDHGSNVQALRTTATYDPETQEFVVNTPDDGAHKEWIGNAACDGIMAAVFCQLIVGDEERGVHALIVPIRSEDGGDLDGLRIQDTGAKLGLNGVDNGRLWFDNLRVPREALLDRFASVSPEGGYTSPIENPNKRFFTMLGTLIQGEEHVKQGAAARMRAGMQRGDDPFDVLNDCQDHAVLLGTVYASRVILEAFADAVERCPDHELQAVLARVCDLYALAEIEHDRGWFQEHGKLSSTRSKAVIKAVNAACDELAEHATLLVEAFGVPEASLGDARHIQGA